MRVSMGIVKNSHGVYHERKKVPKALEEAVALVIGCNKAARCLAQKNPWH